MPRLVLTPEEKRVLLFVVACFLIGWTTKTYRTAHPADPPPQSKSHQAGAAAPHRKH